MYWCWLEATWKAGYCSQGNQGNLPIVPCIFMGLTPGFHATSSQAHVLAISLTLTDYIFLSRLSFRTFVNKVSNRP